MKSRLFFFSAVLLALTSSCSNQSTASEKKSDTSSAPAAAAQDSSAPQPSANRQKATAAEILAKKQVPVLCYHHIKPGVAKNEYEVTVEAFKKQMKILADSGYKTITPEQHYQYLVYNQPLPEKPVMLTYDDTDEEQFSIAKPEMDKYGFKGVYYIMTISIGRPRYMTKEQIKQLSDEGHVIGSHTWDHHRVDRYKYENEIEVRGKKKIANDYDVQIGETKTKLEDITGKPVESFAYPFGLWSKQAIPEIEKRGYKMAYILSTARDNDQPLYTTRRIIVAPTWSAEGMLRAMRSSFK